MITSTECEREAACPNSTVVLQPVFGTDKRNPVFSVYRAPREPVADLHVYYGAELLEVVPEDRRHPAFKLLLGRLYNAGVKAVTLQGRFGVDRKSLQRWGRALCSDDPQQLVRALAGRSGPRKFTPEIRAFVAWRFAQLYGESRSGYSQRLREEIATVFKVRLSGECLRPYLRQLKAELRHESGPPSAVPPTEKRATTCVDPAAPPPAGPAVPGTALVPREVANRNQSPVFSPPESAEPTGRFCRHLGVLLFSAVLLELEKQLAASGWLLKQWLATLLLGAVNIEQTKLLDFEDLERLLGRTLRSLFPQRTQLTELAAGPTVSTLLRCNAQLVGAAQARDFYFDPHTKHYTGQQPILKGWCARIRWADKVLHSDFFHTTAGEPVYLECADNYLDLRERFAALLPRFRQQLALPADAVITVVIDRGIFSHEVFAAAIADPAFQLITWEKNYQPGQWDPAQRAGECVLERTRNHAADKQLYRFEYLDRDWAKQSAMRQLVVRATNPHGRTAELAVLTDDRQRPAAEVITLMFSRWIQENDFKYLDEHFGINQITSYASVAYERLQEQLAAKQSKSGAYKALEQQRAHHKATLGKLLLAEHRHPGRSAGRTARITALTCELAQVEGQLAQTQKEVSRLELLISQQMVRLNTRNKRLLDSVKLIARNAFYQTLAPFKRTYDNYRDDHALFRNFTQADGLLVETQHHVDAYLLPTANHPPKLQKIFQDLLARFNASAPLMPDGSGRTLRLHLAKKAGLQLAIDSGPNHGFY
jgi:hypothetical protein